MQYRGITTVWLLVLACMTFAATSVSASEWQEPHYSRARSVRGFDDSYGLEAREYLWQDLGARDVASLEEFSTRELLEELDARANKIAVLAKIKSAFKREPKQFSCGKSEACAAKGKMTESKMRKHNDKKHGTGFGGRFPIE